MSGQTLLRGTKAGKGGGESKKAQNGKRTSAAVGKGPGGDMCGGKAHSKSKLKGKWKRDQNGGCLECGGDHDASVCPGKSGAGTG